MEINKKDKEAMMKDFETIERRKKAQKDAIGSIVKRNNDYKLKIKRIKRDMEEEYQRKNAELAEKLDKKNKVYLTSIEEKKGEKEENKKKNIQLLKEKEEKSKKNVEINLMKLEEKRLKDAEETFKKSKKNF